MKIAALMFAAVCAGCASVVSTGNHHDIKAEGNEAPVKTVMIENTGWLLFNVIPICSGEPKKPNRCSFRIFEDSTTLQNNLDMLEQEMKRTGATRIANLYSKTLDESIFFLLLTRTACRTSAVLLK